MKEIGITHWITPNTGATNLSNFTGLPGGGRDENGVFSFIGNNGIWWSSTEVISGHARYRYLSYDLGELRIGTFSKRLGFSVRCLLD
jgi:uncharacterized protein (TIGR02145 family)